MTRTRWIYLCAALSAACTDNQDPKGASRLWDAIHADDYRAWERAPGYEVRRRSESAHGNSVDIYVNDVIAAALAQGEALDAWPVGSRIVKDGFDDADLELIAAMEKREDGWFWAEWDDEGDASYSGKPDLCIDCHDSGEDFVRAFGLP